MTAGGWSVQRTVPKVHLSEEWGFCVLHLALDVRRPDGKGLGRERAAAEQLVLYSGSVRHVDWWMVFQRQSPTAE